MRGIHIDKKRGTSASRDYIWKLKKRGGDMSSYISNDKMSDIYIFKKEREIKIFFGQSTGFLKNED